MSWILWGGSSEEPPFPKPCDPELRETGSLLPTENSDAVPDLDADDADGDDSVYELEWDSWPQDLVRQARSGMDKHIAVTAPEPSSAHALRLHGHLGLARSTSNVSLSVPVSPAVRHEILSSANMDLLSVDSPALLTAPGVLPLQGSGVTTSTVSVGNVVRTRSLMSVDGGRGRGVARAMQIPIDDGAKSCSPRKQRVGKQKWTREEYSMSASATSTTSMHSSGFSPTSTIRSTVSMHDGDMLSPKQSLVSSLALPGGGATSTTTLPATTQPVSRRSSTTAETPRPVVSSDKAGKGKRVKNPLRSRAFSAERLVAVVSKIS